MTMFWRSSQRRNRVGDADDRVGAEYSRQPAAGVLRDSKQSATFLLA
jgi:hypothetical protein